MTAGGAAWRWLPLAAFAAAAALLAGALLQRPEDGSGTTQPQALPSAWTGRVPPAFDLPVLAGRADDTPARLSSGQLKGQTHLVHVWATWCPACREEQPLWSRLAREAPVPVVGLLHRDSAAAGRVWIDRHGPGATWLLHDEHGDAGHDWGVYGVPETFVVDATGAVRLRIAGPLTEERWEREVRPWLEALPPTAAPPGGTSRGPAS